VKFLGWFSILGILLVLGKAQLRADNGPMVLSVPSTNQPAAGSQVTTGWNPSPDSNVVGYYLCWGFTSGQCTNLIDVGNVTNATIGSLTTNVLYYFTVVAYDAAGQRAEPSNEIQYMATNLTVPYPPSILADLTNQSAVVGSSVSFQVGVGGSAPLSFRWLFNGQEVPGATTNILVLNKITTSQDGAYQVVVTNSAGSVTSSIASLAVLAPPSISPTANTGHQMRGTASAIDL